MQQKGPNAALEAALAEHDAELKNLQVRYEQYFLGIERREPAEDRAALRKGIMALKRENIRNTALKFRLNSLWNKLLSYERMWNRTVKEIEEGRYRRDVFKAKLRGYDTVSAKAEAKKKAAQAASAAKPDAEKRTASPAAGNGSTKEEAARAPRRPAPGAGGISEDKVDRLYKAFMMAKRKCKEDVSGLSRDALARSLRKQLPNLQSKHKGKSVDFKVVIKGGKAVLKAVPK